MPKYTVRVKYKVYAFVDVEAPSVRVAESLVRDMAISGEVAMPDMGDGVIEVEWDCMWTDRAIMNSDGRWEDQPMPEITMLLWMGLGAAFGLAVGLVIGRGRKG